MPEIVTVPAVGCVKPPMMLSSVLLPQPEGPSRQTNSPLRMSSETSSRARTLCDASRPTKVIETRSTLMAAAPDAAASDAEATGAWIRWLSAVTSDFYRDELVVVDHLRIRDEVEDPKVLERIADHIDRDRIPGAVGREASHLVVIDPRHDALAHLHHLGARLHDEILVRPHEGHGFEPGPQEAPQLFGPLLDHLIGGKDDVRVEVLLDVAEQQDVTALVLFLELVAGGGLDHHAVELTALHGGEPRRHGAERHHLDAFRTPSLLLRQFARQPFGQRAEGGDADALAFEIRDGTDRRAGEHGERQVCRRPVHGGDADRGHALGAEAQTGAGADRDVDRAGGERLLHLRIAAKGGHRQIDVFLLPGLGVDADLGRAESEGVGDGFPEPDLVLREGLTRRQDERRRQRSAHHASSRNRAHRSPSPFGAASPYRLPIAASTSRAAAAATQA